MWTDEPVFCPKCGGRLRLRRVEGRSRPACPECPFVFYRTPASASAAVVLKEGAILLVKRKNDPFRGTWTFPAGYQEVDETPAESAVRVTGPPLTYRDAGIDIDRKYRATRAALGAIRATFTPNVLSDIGLFGGLFRVDPSWKEPVLVATTDGVGTKLKVALLAGKHDTV